MNLTSIPWGVALAGWAAIAGGLYLLQRLRVQHREVEVPTTLFWREAVEETRARVLVRRFRHPWAYLLLLGIGSLMWFAAAGLRSEQGADQQWLLVMDGSAGMDHGDRYAESLALLQADAAALPADSREVWWMGAGTRTLLRRGEHVRLLSERLEGLAPEAAPARIEELLHAHLAAHSGTPIEVRVYGDAPLREDALALLPEGVDVLRRAPDVEARTANAGFVALGVSEASSGRWDRVDVYVEVRGATELPTLSLDGTNSSAIAQSNTTEDGTVQLRYRDLPARGQLLTFELPEDEFPADDLAQIVLPNRPALRVAVAADLQAQFGPLIEADPALQLASGEADLVIRRMGGAEGAGLPALEIATVEQSASAFFVRHDGYGDPQQLLQTSYARLGLAEVDALSLAQELQRPVGLAVETGGAPSIVMWDALLDEQSGFPATRSFPLFIARGLRWLADVDPLLPSTEAGRPLGTELGRWTDAAGRDHDGAGASLRLAEAGLYQDGAGGRIAVSLLDASATGPLAAAGLQPDSTVAGAGGTPLWIWLALLAFVLLLIEGLLYQRGRMP